MDKNILYSRRFKGHTSKGGMWTAYIINDCFHDSNMYSGANFTSIRIKTS